MPTEDTAAPASFSRLEDFSNYFEISLARTRKQRDLVYQLRYRVYCEEFGYEPTAQFSNQQEIDEFDCQSIHCLVTHKETGNPAGCVRVVMVEGNDHMPMEVHAGDSIDRDFIDSFKDQRGTLCEISRLAVDSSFRRRRRERESRIGDIESLGFSPAERRAFPLIALALILGAGAAADVLDRKNCFAIMEPSLPAMMKRAGIGFRRVGSDFQFRGLRAPYYGHMDALIGNAPPDLRVYFSAVRERFASVLVPPPSIAPSSSHGLASLWYSRNSLPWWPLVQHHLPSASSIDPWMKFFREEPV